ncbi:interleukin-15 [Carassius gibelio]|uniref:interleukin-15 n=1 Tax=Carassius gibelio TaxID=101364 RepID=UPI00163716E5|nr:interleukin-15 [Carassius gibelio]
MILMTLFLVFTVGFWNKPAKLKSKRTGRYACNPWCFESHMECLLSSEVWNSILILSCLSVLLPLAGGNEMQAMTDLQIVLKETKPLFQRSNTSLYTPYIEDINNCTFKFFDCFLMEMNVLLHDEDPTNEYTFQIKTTLEEYNKNKCSERYPCELQELTNTREFFNRMTTFLQKQQNLCRETSTIEHQSTTTCD